MRPRALPASASTIHEPASYSPPGTRTCTMSPSPAAPRDYALDCVEKESVSQTPEGEQQREQYEEQDARSGPHPRLEDDPHGAGLQQRPMVQGMGRYSLTPPPPSKRIQGPYAPSNADRPPGRGRRRHGAGWAGPGVAAPDRFSVQGHTAGGCPLASGPRGGEHRAEPYLIERRGHGSLPVPSRRTALTPALAVGALALPWCPLPCFGP